MGDVEFLFHGSKMGNQMKDMRIHSAIGGGDAGVGQMLESVSQIHRPKGKAGSDVRAEFERSGDALGKGLDIGECVNPDTAFEIGANARADSLQPQNRCQTEIEGIL